MSLNNPRTSSTRLRDSDPDSKIGVVLPIRSGQGGFFRQSSTPSGSNLAEGDLWYNTSSEELFVYRQVSGGYEWHTIASAGGSSPTSFTLDGGSF